MTKTMIAMNTSLRHMLDGIMTDINGFETFYKSRRKRLLERIVEVLNRPSDTPVPTVIGPITSRRYRREKDSQPDGLTDYRHYRPEPRPCKG